MCWQRFMSGPREGHSTSMYLVGEPGIPGELSSPHCSGPASGPSHARQIQASSSSHLYLVLNAVQGPAAVAPS